VMSGSQTGHKPCRPPSNHRGRLILMLRSRGNVAFDETRGFHEEATLTTLTMRRDVPGKPLVSHRPAREAQTILRTFKLFALTVIWDARSRRSGPAEGRPSRMLADNWKPACRWCRLYVLIADWFATNYDRVSLPSAEITIERAHNYDRPCKPTAAGTAPHRDDPEALPSGSFHMVNRREGRCGDPMEALRER
jgi:hypothetical protein